MSKKTNEENEEQIDYDTHWKEIIVNLFEDCIAFFLPEAYPLIDFEKPVEFLEQELHKIVADNHKKGKVINDKLVKVYLKDGQEKWILIHIEVQASSESGFLKRMFVYYYRIFDQYEQEITAIAIYTGEKVLKEHKKYQSAFLGTTVTYEFNTYLVKDADDEELIASDNPFALAVLATRYLHQAKSDYEKRFGFKRKLVELARDKNYTDKQILGLFKFMYLILALPKPLEELFSNDVIQKFIKNEDMKQKISPALSNSLHIAVYGKSLDEFKAEIKALKKELSKKDKALKKEEALKKEFLEKAEALKKEEALKKTEALKKEEALKKNMEELIERMLAFEKLNVKEIAELMSITVSEVKAIQDKM